MQKKLHGFTLVELMVTIAVAAILLAIGVPSLTSIYESVRVNNNITKIHDIMVFARSQAISYGATVIVCPYASKDSCGSNWSDGIRVYQEASSTTLRVIDGFSTNDSVAGPSDNKVTFSADGLSSGGTFTYTPNGKSAQAKKVYINIGGIISYNSKN